jgi:hypothetical protein
MGSVLKLHDAKAAQYYQFLGVWLLSIVQGTVNLNSGNQYLKSSKKSNFTISKLN